MAHQQDHIHVDDLPHIVPIRVAVTEDTEVRLDLEELDNAFLQILLRSGTPTHWVGVFGNSGSSSVITIRDHAGRAIGTLQLTATSGTPILFRIPITGQYLIFESSKSQALTFLIEVQPDCTTVEP